MTREGNLKIMVNQKILRNSALEHEITQRQLLEDDRRNLVLRLEVCCHEISSSYRRNQSAEAAYRNIDNETKTAIRAAKLENYSL